MSDLAGAAAYEAAALRWGRRRLRPAFKRRARKACGAFLAVVLVYAGATPAAAAEAPPGAASCSGCHPANASADTSVPRLAGQDASAIISAMQAFRRGQRPATVMDRIAKGFSDDEIKAIAAWFVTQR